MQATLGQIASLINGYVEGNSEKVVSGIATVEDILPHQLTFLFADKYIAMLDEKEAGGILIEAEIFEELKGRRPEFIAGKHFVVVHGARVALVKLLYSLERKDEFPLESKGSADDAVRGENVRIYPNVYIGRRVKIGSRVTLFPGVSVGDDAVIGDDSTLYPNVVLYRGTKVGNRVAIHAGAVIGADGFGYIPVDGKYLKIPQVGIVEIEDDVEIGANATIDRATVSRTLIKRGTKIDNLVHIAHNVAIGEDGIICGQAGIAGSTRIGDRVMLGGKAGIVDNRVIGNDVKISPNTGVIKNLASGQYVSGFYARPHKEYVYQQVLLTKLAGLIEDVASLKAKLNEGR